MSASPAANDTSAEVTIMLEDLKCAVALFVISHPFAEIVQGTRKQLEPQMVDAHASL